MGIDFSKLVKEHGSVEKALEATGATKNADGSWTAGSGGSSGSSPKSSASPSTGSAAPGATAAAAGSGGSGTDPYAETDYHHEASVAAAEGDWDKVMRMLGLREEKINELYGGHYGDKKTNAQILSDLQAKYGPIARTNDPADSYDYGYGGSTGPGFGRAASGAAPEYGGSKWDAALDAIAQELLAMNYGDWTRGEQYAVLAGRYGDAGLAAMKNILGQLAARTGGLASSWAATVADQQYNDYMARLEETARQMYEDERGEKLKNAQLARQLAGDDYERYLDLIEQWNADRRYDYDIWRAAAADAQAAEKLALQRAQAEAKASGSSGSKGSTSPSAGRAASGAGDYDALFTAAEASGYPKSYIANHYKDYGFTSSSGLYDEYANTWARGVSEARFDAVQRSLNQILSGSRADTYTGYLASVWDSLSVPQKRKVNALLGKYGLDEYGK